MTTDSWKTIIWLPFSRAQEATRTLNQNGIDCKLIWDGRRNAHLCGIKVSAGNEIEALHKLGLTTEEPEHEEL